MGQRGSATRPPNGLHFYENENEDGTGGKASCTWVSKVRRPWASPGGPHISGHQGLGTVARAWGSSVLVLRFGGAGRGCELRTGLHSDQGEGALPASARLQASGRWAADHHDEGIRELVMGMIHGAQGSVSRGARSKARCRGVPASPRGVWLLQPRWPGLRT